MALPMIGTRKKLPTPLVAAEPEEDAPHVAATAGPTPEGAIGGDEVLAASRNLAETGQVEQTPVTDSMRETGYVPGELASTGETKTPDATPQENPAMEPDAPEPEQDPLGQLFEDYARGALGPQDTSEQEALIRDLMEQQQGMDLYDARAAAGRSGFASSGAQAGIEGDIRRRAAQAAAGDILDVRRQAQEDAFDRAVRAAGISIDEARFASDEAYRQSVLDAMREILGGSPPAPPAPPAPPDGGGGGGDPTGISTGTSPFGEGTDQTELAAPPNPDEYATRTSHDDGDTFIENYTDPDGKTWSVYVTPDGERYRVPMGS